MEFVVKTDNLTKKYKKNIAVNSVNMNISKGDIYGFVGENGSGKTTVIRLLTGLIFPDSGSFKLFGTDNNSPSIGLSRARMGAVVETPSIAGNMSAYDNLKTQCTVLGVKDDGRIASVLEEVGLSDLLSDKKHASNFSLGMRQRLGIAMALLSEPEFLILDEPMNGLDPAGIVSIRELILKLNRERGITFLISSHILSELSLVATKYGIISKGRLVEEITAEDLYKKFLKKTSLVVSDPEKVLEIVKETTENEAELTEGGVIVSGEIELNLVLSEILGAGVNILEINTTHTSFEDYYLSLLGGAK